ncbi:MAG: cation diffusion facilitator family transporter [Sulfolobales archaeon]
MRRRLEEVPLILSFLFNIVSIAIKVLVFLSTYSRSVFAEIFHSVGDILNSFALYQGFSYSTKPPSIKYPFGRARFTYMASMISSVLLAGSVFHMIVVEGFISERSISIEDLSLWRSYSLYLLIPVLFDVTTMTMTMRIMSRTSYGGRAVLKPLILEDLLGISGNALAILSLYISNNSIDLYLSTIIAVIIIISAGHIVYENIGILVGVSAPREVLWRIVRSVIAIPEVIDINDIKSLTLEPGEYIVIIQVEISPESSLEEIIRVKEMITETIREIEPSVRYVIIDIVKPQEPSGSFTRILRELRELK